MRHTHLFLFAFFSTSSLCGQEKIYTLLPSHVADPKGNTPSDTWQFWFELAHQRGRFQRLNTFSESVPKKGIARKITGPIASMLPNPDDTTGWIFHRDWDGRFEGIWADDKEKQVIAYPYVEKTAHCAVAVTWLATADGNYDVDGHLTDLQVSPEFKQHDGAEWRLVLVDNGKMVREIGKDGPFGDGHGRPDDAKFQFSNLVIKKGQMLRLEIHPRKWWGSDMTRIDRFTIRPTPVGQVSSLSDTELETRENGFSIGQAGSLSYGADCGPAKAKPRAPKPTRFALVFSFGYGGDSMPKEPAKFDELLKKIKDAGFNVVHCTYSDERLALCKKHDVQMMVDLLAPEHHVYKSPDKAQAVCEKLRKEPSVWGYNLWNDPIRKTYPGRKRDIDNVRHWDPTHPAYLGTYRVDGMKHIDNADVLGYYDFHWKRGRDQHFPHLLAYQSWAKERDAWFCSWLSVTSGLPGKGNYNRCLWSANTSIACGQKGILWFLATDMMNAKTLAWTEIGRDIEKVNREIAPLATQLPRLGNPVALWSTPISRTANNDPLPDGKKEMMPPGLEKLTFNEDAWVRPLKGEMIVGAFEADNAKHLFAANHNAYAEQFVELDAKAFKRISRFDGATGTWRPLEQRKAVAMLHLMPGGGALLRLETK